MTTPSAITVRSMFKKNGPLFFATKAKAQYAKKQSAKSGVATVVRKVKLGYKLYLR